MPKPKTARANPALRLALLRQLHVWISVFVAPSLIFFAATGALQTFRIPDKQPPASLIQKLARVHKDDVFAPKPARPRKPEAAGAAHAHDAGPPEPGREEPRTAALKWFFALSSVAIAVSAALGLWMALAYGRQKLVNWALFVAGTAVPVLILVI